MASMGYTEETLTKDIKTELKEILKLLPPVNNAVFKYLIRFFIDIIEHVEYNKMGTVNIITCVAPSLQCAPGLIKFCMEDYSYFFEDAPQKAYVPTSSAPRQKPPPPTSKKEEEKE